MTKINDILRTGVLADITANAISEKKVIINQEKNVFNKINNKELFESDNNKKKDLLKIYASDYKKTMHEKHKWVYTFYIISIIILLVIVFSTLACLFLINDVFNKATIIGLICFLGIGLYYLPYFAYKVSLNSQAYGDFYYLKNEKILLNNSGFNYYYYDSRYNYVEEVAMFKFSIDFKKIIQVEYDKRVNELFIYGNIDIWEYKDNKWKLIKFENEKDNNSPTGVLIQNIYNIDLLDLFRKNNVVIKEYNYLDRRKKEELSKEGV